MREWSRVWNRYGLSCILHLSMVLRIEIRVVAFCFVALEVKILSFSFFTIFLFFIILREFVHPIIEYSLFLKLAAKGKKV